jgi:hypothetical protein
MRPPPPSALGNNEQEVQQPPRNKHGAKHHGKTQSRPTSMMLPRSTSGRKSIRAATRGLLLKQGKGTVQAGTTTTTIATASPPSPPASPTSPTLRTSNQSESSSMTISKTRASGFVAIRLPLKFQRDPTLQKLSTSRWLWSPRPSRGLKS